ncbi:hypothetical protein B0H12DRAFT_484084 [Mycena haematopus]|nr:hypothetical protein B0H12DRAFT_484084 [Mycena haematopus]
MAQSARKPSHKSQNTSENSDDDEIEFHGEPIERKSTAAEDILGPGIPKVHNRQVNAVKLYRKLLAHRTKIISLLDLPTKEVLDVETLRQLSITPPRGGYRNRLEFCLLANLDYFRCDTIQEDDANN